MTEDIINKLREESKRRDATLSQKASYGSLSSAENERLHHSLAMRRNSLEAKDRLFQSASWVGKERSLIHDHFRVKKEHSREGLTSSFIDEIIQGSSSSGYFEQGSVMKKLLEANTEVVWYSDRHPNDINYCICVNKKSNTVTVLIRARESILNMIINSSTTEYPNPISHEDYPGNSELIRLRSEIADEMMRSRRDTKKSTVEEIIEKVEKIGHEIDPTGNYHVSVAGHGMAGSMATVLGYFLAADTTFNTASAVRVFSFASSRVGCEDF